MTAPIAQTIADLREYKVSHYKKPNVKKMQAACDAFNAMCPVGSKVRVKLDGVDDLFDTVTISPAEILSGHSPVVWLKNVSGCYLLDRVSPITAEASHE